MVKDIIVREWSWIQSKTTATIECINDNITVTNVVVIQCSYDTIHDLLDRNHGALHLLSDNLST